MEMHKVLILGSGGSGKSTFARQLAAKTQLPLVHLDALYWQPGWIEPSKSDWQEKIKTLVQAPAWIMDGNYGGTLQLRLAEADHIILMDLPAWHCLWNVLKRRLLYAGFTGKNRPGMAAGCPEKLDLAFLRWIWNYRRKNRPQVLQAIATLKKDEAKVLRFRSHRAAGRFLGSVFDV